MDRRRDGKRFAKRPYRVAYESCIATIDDGIMLRHKCDVPLCCNPAHLIPGTAAQNSDDMVSRKRHWTQQRPDRIPRGKDHWSVRNGTATMVRGERHHRAKLTWQKVRLIRKSYQEGVASQRK